MILYGTNPIAWSNDDDTTVGAPLTLDEGVRPGAFTVPGDPEGCVAFEPVLRIAAEHTRAGW